MNDPQFSLDVYDPLAKRRAILQGDTPVAWVDYDDVPKKEAERRAWATVNKETGGGKKSGSGRGKPENHAPKFFPLNGLTMKRCAVALVAASSGS